MIITLENAGLCFGEMMKLISKPEDIIVIFVSFDVDSLCTLRIISNLLKHASKKFSIFPVFSFEQMEKKIVESEGTHVKGFIMINCGGTKDLTKYWFAEKNNFVCILMDSHRPIHHNNVHNKRNILIFDDGHCNFQNCPTEEDNDDIENKLEEEIEEEENLYEEENEEEVEIVDENNQEILEEKIDNVKKTLDEKKVKNEYNARCKNRIQEYYSGTYFGYPACYPAVMISIQTNQESNVSLWLFIVSATYHYLYLHISKEIYDKIYKEFHKHVIALSKNFSTNERKKNVKKEIIETNEENKDPYADVELKSSNKEVHSIMIENDYKLYLYRHWNLYDSFKYSNYTLKNLYTYKEEGEKEIQKLLAFMGIPVGEAKQQFTYMKNEYKLLFKEKILDVSKKFDMREMIFSSFVFQIDEKTQVSASDIVYCAASLLEYPFNISLLEEHLGEEANEKEEKRLKEEGKNYFSANNMDFKYNNFWHCYNFLSFKEKKNLEISLDLSMKFQKAVVNVGTTIKRIMAAKNFRWSVMSNDVNDEVKYFQHPLSLEKLALFVVETQNSKIKYDEKQKENINKPYVLAILNNVKNTYLVAGVLSPSVAEEREKNTFPIRFRLAANKLKAKLIFNNFNDSIIEIPKDAYMAFITELCNQE